MHPAANRVPVNAVYRANSDPLPASRIARGQATTELALAIPLLVLVLVVVSDWARVFCVALTVSDAARAGVQYGSLNRANASDFSGMRQAALNDAKNLRGVSAAASSFCTCGPGTAPVSCSNPGCASPELFVQVTTSATFNTLLNYPGVPSAVPLSSTAIMQVQ